MIHRITIPLLLLLTVGCASTKLTKTWRDPDFAGPIQFKKIVVLAIHPDRAVRRNAENEMVKQIGADKAVAGYTVIADEDRKKIDVIKAKVQEQGFDGAVTMKLRGARSQSAYSSSPSSIHSFYQDYDSVVNESSPSESEVTRTVLMVQTDIYSVTEGKLIWSGTSDVYDPTNAETIVAEIAKSVTAELRKEKLLK